MLQLSDTSMMSVKHRFRVCNPWEFTVTHVAACYGLDYYS